MSNPNVVFWVSGGVGVIVGLSVAVVSLPLLLREVSPKQSEKPTALQKLSGFSQDLQADNVDILKELEVDVPAREVVPPQPAAYVPEPARRTAAPDFVHVGAPAAAAPGIVFRSEKLHDPVPEESHETDSKVVLSVIAPARPSPPAPANTAPVPHQEAGLSATMHVAAKAPQPVALKVPELPERHPFREPPAEAEPAAPPPVAVAKPRYAPAAMVEQPGPRVATSDNYFLPFLVKLWRGEPQHQPAPAMAVQNRNLPNSAHAAPGTIPRGAASPTPSHRAHAKAAKERQPSAEEWKPVSFDDRAQFWR